MFARLPAVAYSAAFGDAGNLSQRRPRKPTTLVLPNSQAMLATCKTEL